MEKRSGHTSRFPTRNGGLVGIVVSTEVIEETWREGYAGSFEIHFRPCVGVSADLVILSQATKQPVASSSESYDGDNENR